MTPKDTGVGKRDWDKFLTYLYFEGIVWRTKYWHRPWEIGNKECPINRTISLPAHKSFRSWKCAGQTIRWSIRAARWAWSRARRRWRESLFSSDFPTVSRN